MWVIKISVHIFSVSLFLKYGTCSNFSTCYPAKEETTHKLQFSFNTNNTNLNFSIDSLDTHVTECSIKGLSCSTESEKKASVELKNISNMHDYNVQVTICNVTRNSTFGIEGLWTLTNQESATVFMNCTLMVYADHPAKTLYVAGKVYETAEASNIDCNSSKINNLLHLQCSIDRIYPKAKCIFLTNDIEMNKTISKLDVNYKHEQTTDKPTYYRCSCGIVLPMSNLRNGTLDVLVTLYPNVTGNASDLIFGTNITHTIELGQTGVTLKDCPEVIEFGNMVSCRCEKSHSSSEDMPIAWFEGNQQKILNSSNIINFKVTQNLINYRCVLWTELGNISATAFYKPSVYIRPYNFTCTKQTDTVLISCNALGVYPKPKCQLIAYDNTGLLKWQNESIPRDIETTLGNVTLYKSECAFNIPDSMRKGLRLVVTMYPQITRHTETDLTFGTNVTILLDNDKAECSPDENIISSGCIVGISVMSGVVAIVIIVACCLYKKTQNNYPSNDGYATGNVRDVRTVDDTSGTADDIDLPEENFPLTGEEVIDKNKFPSNIETYNETATNNTFEGASC